MHPFHIVECSSLIELTSMTVKLLGKYRPKDCHENQEFVLRPDLVFHTEDKRNLLSVRSWNDINALDQMKEFDAIHTSPDVAFIMDSKVSCLLSISKAFKNFST